MSAMRRFLAFSVLFVVAYFLLPSTVWQNAAYVVANLIGFGVLVRAAHRADAGPRRAWLLMAGFQLCTAAGNVVYFIDDNLLHIEPFPSWADLCFLTGYLFLAGGLMHIVRERMAERDRAGVLDAAIVTVGFAVASWVFLMSPLAAQQDTLVTRLVALAYPAADVLVLALGARLLLGGARGGLFGLLGGVLVLQLSADTLYALCNLAGTYHTGHPVDALQLGYDLAWGAIALHPAMAQLTARVPRAAGRRRPRLLLLSAASVVAPVVLIWQVAMHGGSDLVVTACGSLALFLLVVLRMAGLVRTLETTLTEREALEAELQHRATHDDLTGLANRVLFSETVTGALAEDREACVVLFLDLDDFKRVNDTLGHAAGDELLVEVAARLRHSVGGRGVIARLGGDEFGVLVAREHAGAATAVAGELLAALEVPVEVRGQTLAVHASVGVAHGGQGASTDQLLAHADLAMYAAKATGAHTIRRYHEGLTAGPLQTPFVAGLTGATGTDAPVAPAAPARRA